MSAIFEKRSFAIPPCNVDKELIRKLGNFIEREFSGYSNECFEQTKKKMEGEPYYKKYPTELSEGTIRSRMGGLELTFALTSTSRNIQSTNIVAFVDAEWPDKPQSICLEFRTWAPTDKNINVSIDFRNWRRDENTVRISGPDGTWVNGIADQLEKMLDSKKLSYHYLLVHSSIKYAICEIAWASMLFAVLLPLWQLIVPFLKEGTQFTPLYIIILLCGSITVLWPLESLFTHLFPRLEFERTSSAKRARKLLWVLFVGSGFISALLLKLIGL